eukprot:766457-Hanusia_phi.AAC.7
MEQRYWDLAAVLLPSFLALLRSRMHAAMQEASLPSPVRCHVPLPPHPCGHPAQFQILLDRLHATGRKPSLTSQGGGGLRKREEPTGGHSEEQKAASAIS